MPTATTGALDRELEVAARLAREAGALSLRMRAGIATEMKPGNEPVTQADRDASALIVAGLAAVFPGDAVLSEEAEDDRSRLGRERVWIVDPIDGTRDYVAGREGFAVMIGLAVAGRPALGVVYQPTADALYTGVPAAGWAELMRGGTRRPLRVSDVRDLTALRLVASRSHRTPQIDEVRRALGISDELNIGSVGLKVGLISAGERDLYVNPSSKAKAWDTCAPEAILVAAGGRMTSLHGAPLVYDAPEVTNLDGLVASNGHVHAAVIERLAALFPRRP